MATQQENIENLMKAAQMKLSKQQELAEQEQQGAPKDIYADMMAEMEAEEHQSPPTSISRNQTENYQDISIQREPDDVEEYYIDPNDTPIFEDGPGISQIDIWKKQYTREKIFHTQILDKHFVFRTLNRYEYKQIVAIENIDALYREEIICTTCTLWPRNYDFKTMASEDGGYPSTLAQIIMENSGFTKEYGIEVL